MNQLLEGFISTSFRFCYRFYYYFVIKQISVKYSIKFKFSRVYFIVLKFHFLHFSNSIKPPMYEYYYTLPVLAYECL